MKKLHNVPQKIGHFCMTIPVPYTSSPELAGSRNLYAVKDKHVLSHRPGNAHLPSGPNLREGPSVYE